MQSKQAFYRVGPEMEQWLTSLRKIEGETLGSITQELLEWLAWLLPRALRRVQFTPAEASLLCDALNGTIAIPGVRPPLEHEVADAISLDGLDRKWDVDGPTLVEKLRRLDDAQALAVALAVRQWWNLPTEDRSLDEGLQRVGLVRNR